MEDSVLSHPVLQDELNNPNNGDSAHKHLKQQVHIETSTHMNTPDCTAVFLIMLSIS